MTQGVETMKIRVVSVEEIGNKTKIFFLNETEPKPLQLYMAITDHLSLELLTVFNLDTNQFEDVTTLFTKEYLQNLNDLLLVDVSPVKQSKVL